MSVLEIMVEIPRLALTERLTLLELITHTLRDELQPAPRVSVPASQLIGMLKPEQELPADWNWKQAKEDYLTEKHLK